MDRDDSKQWQSLEERAGEPQTVALTQREFREELPVREAPERAPEVLVQLRKKEGVTRRGFFELMGLSAAAAGMAACQRAPVAKVLPYQSEPDGVIPGSALWYASACGGCDAQCGVLYKTRDGRPIKVEGNPKHPVSQGGVCAVGQASILSLYDASRARGPLDRGAASSWTALDQGVRDGLQAARKDGKAIRVIAPARSGPTFEAALAGFVSAWDAKVVRFEATGEQMALAQAHEAAFGVRALPAIHLDRARVIASFACDFLGTYVAPVAFARDWSKGRALPEVPRAEGEEAHPSPPLLDLARRHWQLEPALSLTGANADRREAVSPSELAPALTGLVRRLAARSQHPAKADLVAALPKLTEPARLGAALDTLAAELLSAGERALVLTGATDPLVQGLAIAANQLLGAYGHTINLRAGVPLPAPDL
ncbi:MAG: TAT-variant-translocated molybdopterin oxidoreductase, partial [Deltaproteobacteria bacterium]|nr:TAT-variant-translocated molybdopterin oxidoreductase [Deltaproteobacteria bacterium]